jgi:hypothetical protein
MLISIREQTTENFPEEARVNQSYAKKTSQRSGCALLLVRANVDISTQVPKGSASRFIWSRAANTEAVVIVALSMIPHIDLLWHMRCSGSLCNARRMNPLARTPNFYSTTVQRKS